MKSVARRFPRPDDIIRTETDARVHRRRAFMAWVGRTGARLEASEDPRVVICLTRCKVPGVVCEAGG